MGLHGLGRGLAATAAATAALLAGPVLAKGWPNALPAQPLVQAEHRCAPGVVALNRRCKVVDFARLGQASDGRELYYAFYGTRWADRHGTMERGFPIIYYLEQPATLRLGLWVNDEPGLAGHWAMTAPLRPVLLNRPDADYVGFTLKAVRGPDAQRLFRRDKTHWKNIDILHRTDADQAKLDAVTPRACEAADDGFYDWTHFRLVLALRDSISHAPCGLIFGELDVKESRLAITSATYSKVIPGERTPQAGLQMIPAPLTPGGPGHTSRSR
ncbi:hypothetical protein [Phenylobacterium montanum]|uniref:DUF1349 domain-containing protein n=1 Tax=Phenylobacterium montanum TaxID=2823693 RepID=A0A975IT21_9CAUL|nr:hypothetical protein [Caulobacter sp. S6]QUD86328.1 hypothetical protein KCG34_14605 [Caulobacter sp. S6]